jgi:hypothetical protein
MTPDALKILVRQQTNALLRLIPEQDHTRFLMTLDNSRPSTLSGNERSRAFALEFADSLIFCADESAASRLIQQDQEGARSFLIEAIGWQSEDYQRPLSVEAATLLDNPLPFYAIAAWMIDAESQPEQNAPIPGFQLRPRG